MTVARRRAAVAAATPVRREPATRPYRLAVAILQTAVRVLRWRVDIGGLEHLPRHGPALLVTNHVSYVDPILLGLAVERHGRTVHFLAKRELFDHWFTGPVVRGADQILVDRRGDAGAALRHAEAALSDGKLVVVYPEGTIHAVFDRAKGKTGAARLALACQVPVLPAVTWGGQQVGTKTGRMRLGFRSAHVVRIGAPVPYSARDSAADLTARLMDAVADLLQGAAAQHPVDLGPAVTDI